MSLESPNDGNAYWRLVEIGTGMKFARYLTIQLDSYQTAEYRDDWETYYAYLWEEERGKMVLNRIGDSYGPWHTSWPI